MLFSMIDVPLAIRNAADRKATKPSFGILMTCSEEDRGYFNTMAKDSRFAALERALL
jgi:hypothetical protein